MIILSDINSTFVPIYLVSQAARVQTLTPDDMVEFPTLSPPVQHLLRDALALTTENLSYIYGSDEPRNGGMDCSGTIHFLLTEAGLTDVPRDSSGIYTWVWKTGRFRAVLSASPDTFELNELKPGDLLFWTGTYEIDRDPPVTHVMIYLGINKLTGRRVMMGASDGRTFNGRSCFGVSVFDFKLPGRAGDGGANSSTSRFVGYGPIPVLEKMKIPASKDDL